MNQSRAIVVLLGEEGDREPLVGDSVLGIGAISKVLGYNPSYLAWIVKVHDPINNIESQVLVVSDPNGTWVEKR